MTSGLPLPDVSGNDWLLALHLNAAVQRFGAAALGVIDLPALSEGALVPAQLRVGAALYWCMAVEQAGLVTTVEGLAREFRAGGLNLEPGATAARLDAFARNRPERFTSDERRALYERVFDSTVLEAFGRLAQALDEAAREPLRPGLHARTGIATIGREVAQLVSSRSVRLAGFAAREIDADIRAAWAILQDRQLQGFVGVGSAWEVVRRLGPSFATSELQTPDRANSRAESGRTILAWLADSAQALEAGGLAPTPEILSAGARWCLASR